MTNEMLLFSATSVSVYLFFSYRGNPDRSYMRSFTVTEGSEKRNKFLQVDTFRDGYAVFSESVQATQKSQE